MTHDMESMQSKENHTMYLDGTRNCGIFPGFLQRTDSPGRFRLHQSALPGSLARLNLYQQAA